MTAINLFAIKRSRCLDRAEFHYRFAMTYPEGSSMRRDYECISWLYLLAYAGA